MNKYITLPVSNENLTEAIVQNFTREEMFELIKEIDLDVADWDFTLMLYEHFNNEMKNYEEDL